MPPSDKNLPRLHGQGKPPTHTMKKPTTKQIEEAIDELDSAGIALSESAYKIAHAAELSGIRCKCLIDSIQKAAGVLYGKLHRLAASK